MDNDREIIPVCVAAVNAEKEPAEPRIQRKTRISPYGSNLWNYWE